MSEREVRLIDHIPFFMREYKEMRKLLEAENPEFQFLCDGADLVRDNLFILSCDEEGIERFERLMNITPLSSDSLEVRRSRVLTQANDNAPYTYETLLRKLRSFCGEDFSVFPDFSNYEIQLMVSLPAKGQIEELEHLLEGVVPANILVRINNVMNHTCEGVVSTGVADVTCRKFTI